MPRTSVTKVAPVVPCWMPILAVLMLASDLGAWIYGPTLVADGGELLGDVH